MVLDSLTPPLPRSLYAMTRFVPLIILACCSFCFREKFAGLESFPGRFVVFFVGSARDAV